MNTWMPSFPKIHRRKKHTALFGPALAADLWAWLPQVTIALTILIAAALFLWPSPFEFPMDDSYIHFVYAQNLSEHGRLFFNDPAEKGVGSSSLLWVLALGAANRAGLSLHWAAKLLGILSLAGLGVGLFQLLRPLLPPWPSLAGALLVVLSGHMIWFALSGMETTLFLALGVAALLCYREERWAWLGVVLGLLAITRVDGAMLALVIGVFDIWRRKAITRGLLVAAAAMLLISGPWIVYLWLRTGYLLPTSGMGRHFSNLAAIQIATERVDSLAWLSNVPALAYPLLWIGYAVEFILGGFALPAPYLEINPGLGSFNYKLSVWAVLGMAAVVLPLTWLGLRRLAGYIRTQGWEKDTSRLPWISFLAWMFLHNFAYMLYLPVIGAASRYASLNHIALWLGLWLGLCFVPGSRLKYGLAAGLAVIALANMLYWNRVYDANLDHMLNVRIAAGNYLRDEIPEGNLCAAFDVGALRYYSRRPLVDLGGLVDPDLIQWFLEGRMDQYLSENHVKCLAVPGRPGTMQDGVIDILKESGLGRSSLFKLQQERVFRIDYESFLVGYQPTVNYQATVTIYKLVEPE